MNALITLVVTVLFSVCTLASEPQQVVISEGGVDITYDELRYLLSNSDKGMRQSAANDLSTRFELLSIYMVNKKMAREAQRMSPDSAGDAYWDLQLQIRGLQQKAAMDQYLETQEKPDFSALARERYQTQKDKYALVPERRLTSHILLSCEADCDREQRFQESESILAELKGGADFAELARRYSEDPGSKENGGQLNTWIDPSAQGKLVKQYITASLKLEQEGDLSDIVVTRYGFHIIRLDKYEPSRHLAFEEVGSKIERAVEIEWKKLALKNYQATFQLSEDTKIDGAAMEELFAPYVLPALQQQRQ